MNEPHESKSMTITDQSQWPPPYTVWNIEHWINTQKRNNTIIMRCFMNVRRCITMSFIVSPMSHCVKHNVASCKFLFVINIKYINTSKNIKVLQQLFLLLRPTNKILFCRIEDLKEIYWKLRIEGIEISNWKKSIYCFPGENVDSINSFHLQNTTNWMNENKGHPMENNFCD